MNFKVIYLDISKCIGCGNCIVACEINEKINPSSSFGQGSDLRNILRIINGKVNTDKLCEQCTDAPCVLACPEKLLVFKDNIVSFNLDEKKNLDDQLIEIYKKCNECKNKDCIEACKFGDMVLVDAVIHDEKLSYPIKCNQCDGNPRCVEVCPTGALLYVDVNEQKFKEKLKFAELLARSASSS
ncbi:MAG: 4Fe-4S dicluster domain-containing protein [Candidatus Helarchaeota archaeon]